MPSNIIFITGGQRSGKSRYAQQLALQLSEHPVYIATARVWDNDFKNRIERHKADRANNWETIEEEKFIRNCSVNAKVVVLDCITLWLTNFFTDNNFEIEKTLREAQAEWDKFIDQDFTLVVVSNELGMGIHPENEAARNFADLQGWMNQHIARNADKVILMVAGLPVCVKS